MDIATLRLEPIEFDVAPFGPMKVNVTRVKFLAWVERQFKNNTLTGHKLVAALVDEYADFAAERTAVKSASNAAPEVLDQVAAAIRTAAGNYFVGVKGQWDQPAQDQVTDEGADLVEVLGIDQSESDRLLADLRVWYERHVAPMRQMLKSLNDVGLPSKSWLDSHRNLGSRLLPEVSSTLKFLKEINQSSDFLRNLNVSLIDQYAGIGRAASAMNAWPRPMDGLLKNWAFTESLTGKYNFGNLGVASQIATLKASLPDFTVIGLAQKQLGLAAILGPGNQFRHVAEAIGRATAAVDASPWYTDGRDIAYAATSRLALEGALAQGVSADLLKNFDQPANDNVEFFSEALKRGQSMGTAPEFEQLLRIVHQLWDKAQTDKKGDADETRWVGRLSLIFSILAFIVASAALYYQMTDQSEQYLRKIEAHTANIEATNAELLNELRIARQAATNSERLRYVRQRTPLRSEPKGQTVRYVFPDQTIRVVGLSGEWAEVEVFSYEHEAVLRGWIYRGYLRVSPG